MKFVKPNGFLKERWQRVLDQLDFTPEYEDVVIEYQSEYGRGSSRFSLWNKRDIEANIHFFQEYNQTCENYNEILAELQSLLDPKINRLIQVDATKVMDEITGIAIQHKNHNLVSQNTIVIDPKQIQL